MSKKATAEVSRSGDHATPIRANERPRRPITLPDYLPARMVNELTYCPRLFFYEWVEGVFAHSSDTVEGALRHEKLERKSDPLPAPEDEAQMRSRSVELSSETYKLIAKIDLVEADGGRVTPVDYKRGAPRDTDDGPEAWPADRAQICVQALVLRDNGYTCDEGVLYYNSTKQRVRVAIDAELVRTTIAAVEQARSIALAGQIPPPLVDSPKCPRCSLVSICLPDETLAAAERHQEQDDGAQLPLFADAGTATADDAEPLRRLLPARDDLRPLYVTGNGLSVGKSGQVLQVRDRKQLLQEARLNEISQLNIFGNVQLSTQALQQLCQAEKPISYFSYGGWFYGMTQGIGLKNVFLRREQFRRAEDDGFCLRLARSLVASKIRNQRTLLQRNHIETPRLVLQRLRRLTGDASAAASLEQLLGIEGTAARLYFQNFAGMLKVGEETDTAGEPLPPFHFEHRNRRPPRDPVNSLLSFAYSLLAKDMTLICASIGFDPFIGYYHQPRFGRPALALDVMEGFRPLVADSAVLTAVNTRMVSPRDFITVGRSVALTAAGRKSFIQAYEQRIDTLVTHPLFGYRVSYRRIFEIQARLLARVLTGELREYTGFETR